MNPPLPKALITSLQDIPGYDQQEFENVHESGKQITSIRINPAKFSIENCQLPIRNPVPWSKYGFYLTERPSFTFDPFFHAGCYYVQEASSMFLEQALVQTVDLSKPLKVLDLCAAPGGKSTHLLSLLSPGSLLVSNEVIRSRAAILNDNIMKWGHCNGIVTNNDPADFSKIENYFDVIVVDAPCSGSGLFRRDPEAINEWSENNVQLCSQRQQRILADIIPALKPGGILIYATCSYSKEEDEDIAGWLVSEFKFTHCQLSIDNSWGIVETNNGYRFWPHHLQGEGFFISCFRKEGDEASVFKMKKSKLQPLTKKEKELVSQWMQTEGLDFFHHYKQVYAMPQALNDEFDFLSQPLRIVNAGTRCGEIIRDKLIPHHALAMSRYVSPSIERVNLDKENAISYLRKGEIITGNNEKGWKLASYMDQPLGWMNVLQGRVNNYYPKELRILKE